MSVRARATLSLRRILLRTTQSTRMPRLRQSAPCRFCSAQVQHLSWCAINRYRQDTFLQVLLPKTIQLSEVDSSLLNAIRHLSVKSTFGCGQSGSYALLSRRSYETSAPAVEQANTEGFLFERDGREEIKQALALYLELILRVQKQLAIEISQNSQTYVDGLVDKLKLSKKDHPSELKNSLNVAVKELLVNSKFKGVEPFLESLGVNPNDIARVSVYASGMKGVLVTVDLLKAIGIKSEEIPKLISSHPRFLSNALVSHQAKAKYLAHLGMSPVQICKLIITHPMSLSFSLKEGGLPLVTFLKNTGVKDEDIGKVLFRCPQLLTLNVEKKLLPATEMLESVGITGTYLARVLVMQPSLLRRRLEKNIAFCREFGLGSKPGVIARLLVTCPNFSVDGCAARVSYLNSVGLTKAQIVSMINRNPAFLSLNVKNTLAPKVSYVMNVMGRPVDQLVTAATFLTLSLERRIKPRCEVLAALMEAGLHSRTYSLTTIGCWREEYFYEKFVQNSPRHIAEIWERHSTASVPRVGGGVSRQSAA